MSSSPLPFNPYVSPPDVVRPEPSGRGRPGMLTTICVLALALGAIGLLTGASQAFFLFAGTYVQKAMQPSRVPGQNEEIARIQQDMQDQTNAVVRQYFVPNTILVLIHFAVAGMLLLGGGLSLSLRSAGRTILVAVCVLGICYELGRTTLQMVVTMQTKPIMETFMEQTLSATPQGPNRQAQETVAKGMKVGMTIGLYAGIVFAGLLAAAKLAFYIISLTYLSRENIKALFLAKSRGGQPLPGRI